MQKILFKVFFMLIIASNNCIELNPNDMCLREGKKCDKSISLVPCGLMYCAASKQHCILFHKFAEKSNQLKDQMINHWGILKYTEFVDVISACNQRSKVRDNIYRYK